MVRHSDYAVAGVGSSHEERGSACGSVVLPRWVGWCPNQPLMVVPKQPDNRNYPLLFLVVFGVLILPAAAFLLPAPPVQSVTVWAFRMDDAGMRHFADCLFAMENSDGKITLMADGTAHPLPPGRYWLVILHPSPEGKYPVVLDGNSVRGRIADPSVQGDNGLLFTVHGPGSLAGEDAYEALMAALDGGSYVTSRINPLAHNRGVTQREYIVQ